MNTSTMNCANPHDATPPASPPPASGTPDYIEDRRQYQRFYYVCFAIFLLIALVCRVLPRGWQPFASEGAQSASLIDEVRNAVSAVLPFVFMA